MTSGPETERVYSYNPGARTGQAAARVWLTGCPERTSGKIGKNLTRFSALGLTLSFVDVCYRFNNIILWPFISVKTLNRCLIVTVTVTIGYYNYNNQTYHHTQSK